MVLKKTEVTISLKEFAYITNILTMLRILLIPFIIFCIGKTSIFSGTMTFILIAIAFVTDVLDGYLARKLDIVSNLGKILDPIADKLCIISFAITIFFLVDFPLLALVFFIIRDILIIFFGYIIIKRWNFIPPSNIWGTSAFLLQSISIISYIFQFDERLYILILALIFTAISIISYSIEFYKLLRYEAYKQN